MSETILHPDTDDFIGTAIYSDNGRHYRATSFAGRTRSFHYRSDAVAWLTTRYNSTH
jgi:hypothetical protein